MTAEEFNIITDKLVGVTGYLYYHLMGEPLTHPLLPQLVRMANAKGFKSIITTNGTVLKSVGDRLIDAGVYKVNLSLHSFEGDDAEAYDRYIGDCLDFADKASRAGVLVIMRLWNKGYDGGRNEDTVAAMKARFADGEWKQDARGARIRHRLHLEYGDRFEWPDMDAEEGGADVFCYGLSDHFSILCDGTVVPCCLDRNGELALGNVFCEDIEKILTSERAERIRNGFKTRAAPEPLCRKCGYARMRF